MSAAPIEFFNRRTGRVETEQVFGEGWLRFAYENPVGRLSVWLIARRAVFSKWFGRRMSKPESALRVVPFITQYNLDVDEFAKSPFDYKTFNDFFYRALKPGGILLLQGYNTDQLKYGTGGPKQIEYLYTESLLRESFPALEFLHLASHEKEVSEGKGHQGMSALLDLVARRPAATTTAAATAKQP